MLTLAHSRILTGVGILSIAAFLWTQETTIRHPGLKNVPRTFQVTGRVLVNGKPEKDIFVDLVPQHGPVISSGQCHGDGSFVISTFLAGDGAPARTYKVTMRWLTYRQPGRPQWGLPDRLNGRFSDPAKSEIKLIVSDKAIGNLLFDLSTDALNGFE